MNFKKCTAIASAAFLAAASAGSVPVFALAAPEDDAAALLSEAFSASVQELFDEPFVISHLADLFDSAGLGSSISENGCSASLQIPDADGDDTALITFDYDADSSDWKLAGYTVSGDTDEAYGRSYSRDDEYTDDSDDEWYADDERYSDDDEWYSGDGDERRRDGSARNSSYRPSLGDLFSSVDGSSGKEINRIDDDAVFTVLYSDGGLTVSIPGVLGEPLTLDEDSVSVYSDFSSGTADSLTDYLDSFDLRITEGTVSVGGTETDCTVVKASSTWDDTADFLDHILSETASADTSGLLDESGISEDNAEEFISAIRSLGDYLDGDPVVNFYIDSENDLIYRIELVTEDASGSFDDAESGNGAFSSDTESVPEESAPEESANSGDESAREAGDASRPDGGFSLGREEGSDGRITGSSAGSDFTSAVPVLRESVLQPVAAASFAPTKQTGFRAASSDSDYVFGGGCAPARTDASPYVFGSGSAPARPGSYSPAGETDGYQNIPEYETSLPDDEDDYDGGEVSGSGSDLYHFVAAVDIEYDLSSYADSFDGDYDALEGYTLHFSYAITSGDSSADASGSADLIGAQMERDSAVYEVVLLSADAETLRFESSLITNSTSEYSMRISENGDDVFSLRITDLDIREDSMDADFTISADGPDSVYGSFTLDAS